MPEVGTAMFLAWVCESGGAFHMDSAHPLSFSVPFLCDSTW